MNKVKLTALLLALGFLPLKLLAQAPSSLSLKEAVDYALLHSWTIKQSNADVEKAKAKVWETITIGLPQVTATSSYSKYLEIPYTPVNPEDFGQPAGPDIKLEFAKPYNADWGIKATQVIFDGSYIVGLKATKIYVNLSKNATIKTKLEISKAVEEAYYNVIIAAENITLLKSNLGITQKLLTEAKAKVNVGVIEELDVDRLQLSENLAKTEIAKAQRQKQVARVVLNYIMGFEDMDAVVTLTGKLDDVAKMANIDSAPIAFDYTTHIDYIILENQRRAQDLVYKNVVANNLPKVNAFLNTGRSSLGDNANLYNGNDPWIPSTILGVEVSMPLIGFGKMWSKAKQEKLERTKIDFQMAEVQQRINRDLTVALTQLQSAQENYQYAKASLAIALKIYNTSQIKYKNGVGTSADMSKDEQNYILVQQSYISSLNSLVVAKVELDKAINKL